MERAIVLGNLIIHSEKLSWTIWGQ